MKTNDSESLRRHLNEVLTERGYINWSEVARDLAISRQAVTQKVAYYLRRGYFSQEEMDRWKTTRTALKAEMVGTRLSFTSPNWEWVKARSAERHIAAYEYLNDLIEATRTSNLTKINELTRATQIR